MASIKELKNRLICANKFFNAYLIWFTLKTIGDFVKTRYYVIDGLTYDRGKKICKALRGTVPEIQHCGFDEIAGVVEITSRKEYLKQLELACDIAGCTVRTEFKR